MERLEHDEREKAGTSGDRQMRERVVMQEGEQYYNTTLFLRIWAGVFGAFGLPVALFTGFSLYLLIAALAALIPACLIHVLLSRLGNGIGGMLYGGGGIAKHGAEFDAELDKANYLFRNGKPSEAADLLAGVLEKNPAHEQALYLTATICIEKGASRQARSHLRTLITSADPKSPYRKWARQLLRDMDEAQEG